MKLWLVRHAMPVIASGVCYGASDVPADVVGTEAIAKTLALALPDGVVVVASPLQRCACIAASLTVLRPDLRWLTDTRLQEMNFGAWEGQAWDAIDRRDMEAWTADFADWRCGGAESVRDVMQRVGSAWDDAKTSRVETAWITHAGVIRAATLIAKGTREMVNSAQWPREPIAFGQIQTLND